MPRIPVYTTNAAPTTATGKKSWGVRIDSRPYIQAALEKGDTAATATGLITEFIAGRETRRREAEASQALIAAETFMSSKVSELSRSTNPSHVFGPDLTQEDNWNANLMEIRDEFRNSLSPGARRIFDTKFQGISAPYTAKLQVSIDDRINKLAISEFKVGVTGFEEQFVQLGADGVSVFDYNTQLAQARNRGNRLVDQGRLLEEEVETQIEDMIYNTASGALTTFMVEAGNPVELAMMLQNDDDLDGEELAQLAETTPHGAYVLHVLNSVTDPTKRRALVKEAVDFAFDEYGRNKQLEEDNIKAANLRMRQDYNSIFSAETSKTARQAIFQSLDKKNFMSPAERETAQLFIEDKQLFADRDDDAAIIRLTTFMNDRALTTDRVIAEAGNLTRERFQAYMGAVGQDLSDSYKAALGDARVKFKYAEERGFDIEEYEQGAVTAYYRALERIRDLEFTSGSSMSPQQLRLEARAIIDEEYLKLKPILQLELDDILKNLENRTSGLTFSRVNGRFNYDTVAQELADHMATVGRSTRLEVSLSELQYLLNMMRD